VADEGAGPGDIYLREDVIDYFGGDPVARAWEIPGEVVRSVAGRQTLRVDLGGRIYFLKRHEGVGWREVLKNWLVFKRPVLGARNEYIACRHLERAGLKAPTVAAFGETGGIPSARLSFVMCDALVGYEDLEQLTLDWPERPPDDHEKRALIMRVARFAQQFHAAGLVHRDFYLCHLLIHNNPIEPLAVLDLHRALVFETVPDRWRERDLAALLFSTLDLPINRLSWFRFVRTYTQRPLRRVFEEEGAFWQRVYSRALALYRKGTAKGLNQGRFQP